MIATTPRGVKARVEYASDGLLWAGQVGVRDITAGYRAYRREVLEKIDLAAVDSKGYCFQIDLTWRAINNGFVVVEVPITFSERELGVSKMSGSNIREAMLKVAEWGVRGRLDRARGVVR